MFTFQICDLWKKKKVIWNFIRSGFQKLLYNFFLFYLKALKDLNTLAPEAKLFSAPISEQYCLGEHGIPRTVSGCCIYIIKVFPLDFKKLYTFFFSKWFCWINCKTNKSRTCSNEKYQIFTNIKTIIIFFTKKLLPKTTFGHKFYKLQKKNRTPKSNVRKYLILKEPLMN